jgi:hypothetical protein
MLKRYGVSRNDALAAGIARYANVERGVEDNGCGVEARSPRQLHQWAAVFAFEARCIGNGQASEPQAHFDDRMHQLEGERRNLLIGRIIADHGAALV